MSDAMGAGRGVNAARRGSGMVAVAGGSRHFGRRGSKEEVKQRRESLL